VNPTIPAPVPVPLPAPLWLLQLLSVFTFILHLLPMNLLLGGTVLLALLSLLGQRDERHRELARRVSRVMPPVVAFTITFGVAPLLFLQLVYGQLFFTSAVLMAWLWLAVVLLVLAGYYGVYWFSMQFDELGSRRAWLILATALLFALVAIIFTQNISLMQRPAEFYPIFLSPGAGNFLGSFESLTVARLLHFVVAALAVAGLGLALLAHTWRKERPELADWGRQYGLLWFIAATGLQALTGLWFLYSLPADVRALFLNQDKLATSILIVALVLAMLALAAARRSLTVCSVAIVGTISLMAVIRHLVRVACTQPYFDPRALPVKGQWVVFGMFAILLVAGLATVGWMLYQFFRPSASQVPSS